MKSKRAPWIASVVLAILLAVLFAGGGQPARVGAAAKECKRLLESMAMLVANAKVHRYLRRNPEAWGTIS